LIDMNIQPTRKPANKQIRDEDVASRQIDNEMEKRIQSLHERATRASRDHATPETARQHATQRVDARRREGRHPADQ